VSSDRPVVGTARVASKTGILAFAVATALFFVLLAPRPAHAADFTVNSTGNAGDATPDGTCDSNPTASVTCTLREAIQEANANNNGATITDTIEFNIPDNPGIPGLEVKTISPTSLLPTITDKVTIDGYTQSGATPNSAITNSNSAVLKIELRGTSAPANAFGLAVSGNGAAGTKIKGLVINRFGDDGVFVGNSAPNTTIEGNFIGTDPTGTIDRGNGADGVNLLSSGNTIGGSANAAQNVISGNGGNGVAVKQSGATSNTISNNHIGTDADAGEDLGNSESGVFVENASGNTIGGSSAAGTLNIISGNNQHGVEILGSGASGTRVIGNLIGVNVNGTGSSDIGNTLDGVFVSSASQVEIGGTAGTNPGGPCAGDCNVISDNGQHGVEISDFSSKFNKVQGNRIGTNINGSSAFGNTMNGVRIVSATDTTIGGTTEEARNVISGNAGNGVFISAGGTAANNRVEGNYIGINADGVSDLGNGTSGVRVEAPGNFIGGTTEEARNVISGNGGAGILFNGSNTVGNLVEGNLIGTNAAGTGNLGNLHGVRIAGALDNTVGGTVDAAANTISGNTNQGVFVSSCTCAAGNRILRNSIFDNGLLGIELGLNEDGPTPNDPKDPDTGPNKLQNFPVITSATTAQIEGKLNSRPNRIFTIQFFSNPAPNFPTGFGEGETFLGERTVTTNGEGKATFTFAPSSLSAGEFVTATATDPVGNTSEFSQAQVVD
jgi:CSLREA domain-containing protein